MRIQRVLLRVRAQFLLKRHDAICNQTTFPERHLVYHDGDHFIHHQRIVSGCASSESHISVVAVWIKSMAFFTRYEVDPLPTSSEDRWWLRVFRGPRFSYSNLDHINGLFSPGFEWTLPGAKQRHSLDPRSQPPPSNVGGHGCSA